MNGGKSGTQLWVIVACATAMALGTSIGGWRIIKTVGLNIMKMQPINGFAAQTGAAIVIEAMTYFGCSGKYYSYYNYSSNGSWCFKKIIGC